MKYVIRGAKSGDDNVGKEEIPPEKSMEMTSGTWMATRGELRTPTEDHSLRPGQ